MFTAYLGIIPLSYIVVELFFYFGTAYMSEDTIERLYKYNNISLEE